MTNYEKLCEAVGLEQKFVYYECEIGRSSLPLCPYPNFKQDCCNDCSKSNKMKPMYKYPAFTAEKQIELIKLISKNFSFNCYFNLTKNNYIVAADAYFFNKTSDFSEALAGLALQLVEAGELDKDEVKRILECG